MDPADLRNRFTYHPPATPDVARTHEHVRDACLQLALDLNGLVPDGPEKTTAMDRLREVMMWANAGIACQPGNTAP